MVGDDLRQEGVEVPVGFQLAAELLPLFFLPLFESPDDGVEDGVHHAVIAPRVLPPGAVPDLGERGHVGGREDRPFEQAVLQLRQAVRIGVLPHGCRLVVGLERLADVLLRRWRNRGRRCATCQARRG